MGAGSGVISSTRKPWSPAGRDTRRAEKTIVFDPFQGNSAGREDRQQGDANRGNIALAAAFGHEAAARFKSPVHALENGILIAHPVQGGVGKDGVEFLIEGQRFPLSHMRASTPRSLAAATICGELSTPRTVAPDSAIRWVEEAVAASQVKDAFAGLGLQGLNQRAQRAAPRSGHCRRKGRHPRSAAWSIQDLIRGPCADFPSSRRPQRPLPDLQTHLTVLQVCVSHPTQRTRRMGHPAFVASRARKGPSNGGNGSSVRSSTKPTSFCTKGSA